MITGQILAAVIFLAIVILQYLSKRSFGFAVIGLIIGNIIASLWFEPVSQWLITVVGSHETNLITVVTQLALMIIPATSLMWVGKTINSKPLRIIGSVVFAALLALLVLNPVASLVELWPSLLAIHSQVSPHTPTIIGLVAVFAVLDVIAHAPSNKQRRTR